MLVSLESVSELSESANFLYILGFVVGVVHRDWYQFVDDSL